MPRAEHRVLIDSQECGEGIAFSASFDLRAGGGTARPAGDVTRVLTPNSEHLAAGLSDVDARSSAGQTFEWAGASFGGPLLRARLGGYNQKPGAGLITMKDGAHERIRCRGTYAVQSGGNNMRQELRCAIDTYKFETSSGRGSRQGGRERMLQLRGARS